MPIELKMPALSPTMEEGTLAKWLVKAGDMVSAGDIMAEIETDKATMEFESFDAGVVLELVASEGQTLPIGSPIAVFGQPGEDAKSALAKGGGGSAKPSEPKSDAKGEAKPAAAKAESEAAPKRVHDDVSAPIEPSSMVSLSRGSWTMVAIESPLSAGGTRLRGRLRARARGSG